MTVLKKILLKFRFIQYYVSGRDMLNDSAYLEGKKKGGVEIEKTPSRTEIINFILSTFKRNTSYLEIGVRDPASNFNHIKANKKYSVDPGIDFKENPVDFKLTSDEFFEKIQKGEILSSNIKVDLIFIDGLHLADQVDKDIFNALNFISDDGFIVLHECNPPTEWHAGSAHSYRHSSAGSQWNGATWKAFLKWRSDPSIYSCCIDSDWGVGIISKSHLIGQYLDKNLEFYDYSELENNREEYLNLTSFDEFKALITD